MILHIKHTGSRRDDATARGQAGIAAVQCLEGDAVWAAGAAGTFSLALAEAALGVVDVNLKVAD